MSQILVLQKMRERTWNVQLQNRMSSCWALPLCLSLLPSQLPGEFSKSLLGKDYPRDVGPRMPGTEGCPLSCLFPIQEFLRLLQKRSSLGKYHQQIIPTKGWCNTIGVKMGWGVLKIWIGFRGLRTISPQKEKFLFKSPQRPRLKATGYKQIFLCKCTHIHTFIFTWDTSMKEVPSALHNSIWETLVNPFYHSSLMQYDN